VDFESAPGLMAARGDASCPAAARRLAALACNLPEDLCMEELYI
jgi:hypothetical protein